MRNFLAGSLVGGLVLAMFVSAICALQDRITLEYCEKTGYAILAGKVIECKVRP